MKGRSTPKRSYRPPKITASGITRSQAGNAPRSTHSRRKRRGR